MQPPYIAADHISLSDKRSPQKSCVDLEAHMERSGPVGRLHHCHARHAKYEYCWTREITGPSGAGAITDNSRARVRATGDYKVMFNLIESAVHSARLTHVYGPRTIVLTQRDVSL
ncbi:hypothetical protein BAUCODRAFT_317502 [Baudoinia panamericana UAMH 10762]|uniref:Uncharacterized protein n=1 Tax=Baudoinia panamericana (strain UAMH 10762) TaxID=717646 RepID=M2MY23_BAUPA|nr:uncharacterized protein BAUCODRAFT_317502 [Baudoinia panamericana UAMH 10762]EMC91175.1 hypothetical protein BAUCODRAFT_317502 [Baudoinia panamericana UAMH 10762]